MRGLCFIECDIDGRGKRWRLTRVHETASSGEPYFVATFIDEGGEFDECLNVFLDNGSRMVGPLTVNNLLACVSAGEYLLDIEIGFLPQRIPGEARITAGKANGIHSASAQIARTGPEWNRINFNVPITASEAAKEKP